MNCKSVCCWLSTALLVSACIQEEALNSEAAIDACTGPNVQTVNINHDTKEVDIYVNGSSDLTQLELNFVIPEGATLTAAENAAHTADNTYDFSGAGHSRRFTVTSEDKQYSASYAVNIIESNFPNRYHFELLSQTTPFHILQEVNAERGEILNWTSGNAGYKLTFQAKSPEDYPTTQASSGYEGKCVKLETRSTGSLGALVGMYIAAGNLFIGSFDAGIALGNALGATQFGIQFYRHPIALRGHYKYKAGEVYSEKNTPVEGKKDRFDIYAILYEADNVSFMLDGSNALTDPSLIATAQIPASEALETDSWTEFNLPFVFKEGKSIDREKLRGGKYKLSIVFSSSIDGARFNGAVGSTLYIDEVKLICEEDEVHE
ncbi:MAG: PCMD domain-containing protein [Prevotellaceae bacterium]|nr:PCMD domain-containing protein [Prevotellaceae bacterium]